MKTTQKEALARIDGSIHGDSIIYYDGAVHRFFVGPVADLAELVELMDSDDEAYSHWCAGTHHGDGYETLNEAVAAAASHELLDTLEEGAELADAVVEAWTGGDLAGAVNDLEAWANEVRMLLAKMKGAK